MALFESGNPTLSEKIFNRSLADQHEGTMTVRGSINKFGFLMLMVLAGAIFTWREFTLGRPGTMQTFMMIGLFGGLISAIIISFKPATARYLAPAYAIFEGLLLGALSVVINNAFSKSYPGIVMQAVGLTFAVAIVMFLLYNFRIIKPTAKFKAVLVSATLGIFLFYMVMLILSFFHVNMAFMSWTDASPLGIGISLFVIAIAALNLILDFEQIETGEAMGAPKYMEWYGAFGLLVTLVWLYIEILKLLSRFASSRN
ncbi:MAG: Bax inhibitor-1/YccA family protein [Bacteroidetes bacterium]|nr:Bax inhibitor-1/YccA family protein [Bacteroidota bacterium]MBS1975511.1 Bax inhibitor-1/YccA family protein [Bacteroidota bacterium]